MLLYETKHPIPKVVLKTCYCLNDEYIPFDSNPLCNKTFENVSVSIEEVVVQGAYDEYLEDVVKIDGYEDIECEYITSYISPEDKDTLIIKICQDWG